MPPTPFLPKPPWSPLNAKCPLSERSSRFVACTATEVHGGIGITDLLGLHYLVWASAWTANRSAVPERVRHLGRRHAGLATI